MSDKKIYIIGNSHMDPIWVWRLREGRSTWLNTCRSVVKMMKKYPFLKFSRSSSVCYQWIEKSDPKLFKEIRKLVDENRWELVGGWVEQSDTIITPGESLIRQAEHGKAYFKEKFGRDIKIAYSVDSFGQNAGLPKILKATGFDYYTWMRPMTHEKNMPDMFRWRCDDNSGDIVSFRILQAYCTLPGWKDMKGLADWFKPVVEKGQKHQTFFFGIGDHGGGFYENQLQWLLKLGEEYDIHFSTLEDYFKIIEKEDLPIVTGEHTHHAPGCYSSVGDIKQWMADSEKNLYKAEKIVLENKFADSRKSVRKLYDAWEELLFNYFHDVYPGTSTMASYKNEIRDLNGMVNKAAVDIIEESLSRIASTIKTDFLTEGGVLMWNPLPQPSMAVSRFDGFNDPNNHGEIFNCLVDGDGNEIPLQWIRAATSFGPNSAWGRAVIVDQLAASEAKAYAYGCSRRKWVSIGFARQKKLLKKIRFCVLKDTYDTWAHGARALGGTTGFIKDIKIEEMENGPVVSRLRLICSWKNSELKLDLFAYRGIGQIEAVVHGNWNEKDETLKLGMNTGFKVGKVVSGQASAIIERPHDDCEQPFIDWVAMSHGNKAVGFLTHALHSYDSIGCGELRLTICRPVVYAEHEPFAPHGDEGYADTGYFERTFWMFDEKKSNAELMSLAKQRLWTAEHLEITAASDGKNFKRDKWEITPSFLSVSAHKRNIDGSMEFHIFNPSDEKVECRILCNGKVVRKEKFKPAELKIIQLEI